MHDDHFLNIIHLFDPWAHHEGSQNHEKKLAT